MGFFDFFAPKVYAPGSSKALQEAVWAYLHGGVGGSGAGVPGSPELVALQNLQKSADVARESGTPFFKSLIPSAPGQLSAAAAAEKDQASQALQSQLASERMGMVGNLQRQFGGRLPAAMLTSGFGNLARAGSMGATDIARQAIQSNVGYGTQGVQGLEGLTELQALPSQVVGGLTGAATAGQTAMPSGFSSLLQPISSLVGAFTGAGAGNQPQPTPTGVRGATMGGSPSSGFGMLNPANWFKRAQPFGNQNTNLQPVNYGGFGSGSSPLPGFSQG